MEKTLQDTTPYLYKLYLYSGTQRVLHSNKNSLTYRIMFLEKGKLSIFIDNQTYELTSGDIFYFIPNTVYSTEFKSDYYKVINLFFGYEEPECVFDNVWLKNAAADVKCSRAIFKDCNILNSYTHIKAFKDAYLITELYVKFTSNLPYKMNMLISFYQIINSLATHKTKALRQQENTVNKILSYIENNLENKLSCKDVASNSGYHPNYLNLLFKSQLGVNLHNYIMSQKIIRGSRMLLETDLPITQIALTLFFYDASHFSNTFLNELGCTPRQYRKLKGF